MHGVHSVHSVLPNPSPRLSTEATEAPGGSGGFLGGGGAAALRGAPPRGGDRGGEGRGGAARGGEVEKKDIGKRRTQGIENNEDIENNE